MLFEIIIWSKGNSEFARIWSKTNHHTKMPNEQMQMDTQQQKINRINMTVKLQQWFVGTWLTRLLRHIRHIQDRAALLKSLQSLEKKEEWIQNWKWKQMIINEQSSKAPKDILSTGCITKFKFKFSLSLSLSSFDER